MNVPLTIEIERDPIEQTGDNESIFAYSELAAQIGFEPDALILYRVREYLRSKGLREYPLAEVESYMDEKFGKPRVVDKWKYKWEHKWGWHPLRPADLAVQGILLGKEYRGKGITDNWKDCTIREIRPILDTPYQRVIPLPVLQTIVEITELCPTLNFIVADEADYTVTHKPDGDPFLALLGKSNNLPPIVFERWDEPSFR